MNLNVIIMGSWGGQATKSNYQTQHPCAMKETGYTCTISIPVTTFFIISSLHTSLQTKIVFLSLLMTQQFFAVGFFFVFLNKTVIVEDECCQGFKWRRMPLVKTVITYLSLAMLIIKKTSWHRRYSSSEECQIPVNRIAFMPNVSYCVFFFSKRKRAMLLRRNVINECCQDTLNEAVADVTWNIDEGGRGKCCNKEFR